MISVILPIYCTKAEYLHQSIGSLQKQTVTDLEILLVDDGSPAYVGEICREYAKQDARIRYLPIAHQGVSVARNTGLEAAKGDYIAFVDPDDWVLPEYLETLLEGIEKHNVPMSVVDSQIFLDGKMLENRFLLGEKRVLKGTEKNDLLYQLFSKKLSAYYPPHIAFGVPWGKLFRRDWLESHHLRFIPGMVRMQDNIFVLYATENAEAIVYLPKELYVYRMEQGSASRRYDPQLISYFEKYYEEAKNFLDTYQKEEVLYKALQMKELTSFHSYLKYYYFHPSQEAPYGEVKKMILQKLQAEPYASALQNIDPSILKTEEKIFVTSLKQHWIYLLKILMKLRNRK
ncbi:MAG: glycosyltransferase [Erysipelotrichaceae bacterium]|nr:glycosyltransferase [Erysipelotrichaceae bacterium]